MEFSEEIRGKFIEEISIEEISRKNSRRKILEENSRGKFYRGPAIKMIYIYTETTYYIQNPPSPVGFFPYPPSIKTRISDRKYQ